MAETKGTTLGIIAYSVDRWLEVRADRIERGETDDR